LLELGYSEPQIAEWVTCGIVIDGTPTTD